MGIVTRPDFDGIVCAVLLLEAEKITSPIMWVSPNDMQKGKIEIKPGDIIANLPYHPNCSLWFDHHFSNRLRRRVKGFFKIAPSAAGLVFEYYKGAFQNDFTELVTETDKIDSAGLSLDEILHPEKYAYVLLSMTVQSRKASDEVYWNHLVALLRKMKIDDVLRDPEVKERCKRFTKENKNYKTLLKKHTIQKENITITDFRKLDTMPLGNRFLVYSMFPDAVASVKIGFEDPAKEMVIIKVGHSILNKGCNVNVGQMLSYFEGGGHSGAGSCRFHVGKTDTYLPRLINTLIENKAEGSIVDKKKRSPKDRRTDKERRQRISTEYLDQGKPERRIEAERRVERESRKNWRRIGKWSSKKLKS